MFKILNEYQKFIVSIIVLLVAIYLIDKNQIVSIMGLNPIIIATLLGPIITVFATVLFFNLQSKKDQNVREAELQIQDRKMISELIYREDVSSVIRYLLIDEQFAFHYRESIARYDQEPGFEISTNNGVLSVGENINERNPSFQKVYQLYLDFVYIESLMYSKYYKSLYKTLSDNVITYKSNYSALNDLNHIQGIKKAKEGKELNEEQVILINKYLQYTNFAKYYKGIIDESKTEWRKHNGEK